MLRVGLNYEKFMPLNESGIYTLGMQCMDLSNCSAGHHFSIVRE